MTTRFNSLILFIIRDRRVSIFRQYVKEAFLPKTSTKFSISVHIVVVYSSVRYMYQWLPNKPGPIDWLQDVNSLTNWYHYVTCQPTER